MALVLVYLLTRSYPWSWLLNNVLGFALCVQFLSLLRIPSLKVATIVLVLIFFYDMFWVFFSKYFFGDNVMVKAASLELPIKLMMPLFLSGSPDEWDYTMIGLGDLVLPGLLVAFALRFDLSRPSVSIKNGYWAWSLGGYIVGLATCYIVLFTFKAAQPAMIYLGPSTVGAVSILGWRRNELEELWSGKSLVSTTTTPSDIESERLISEPNPSSAV
eukprot:CAMPEP_0184674626 /NCGR_PEP_ID=MMETSP0308-20130426/87339_1 /TAXON_ID=38269 /ORGANISM="Gloeochaete witrockiana, Strain SAG 46.84" /LENGTH=215 /DNA_ID=CAMNT_0027122247 /DNA_START=300 /DNA_END=947 /DNA_ORIENTATION=-